MRVHFLGTGGYHPNERRHTACLWLPELQTAFDAGTGTFRLVNLLMTAAGTSEPPADGAISTTPAAAPPAVAARPGELDICLSHAHLDHIVGLSYLLVPMVLDRLHTVRIHAQADAIAAIREHLFAPAVFPVEPEFEYCPLQPGQTVTLGGGARLSHQPLPSHPGGSTAYRVDWTDRSTGRPRSLAYVTDTTVDGTYHSFVRGVDLLIHECYFADAEADWAEKTGHSHLTPIVALARQSNAQRLMLMHVDPRREEDDPLGLASLAASAGSPADGLQVEIARDLQEIDV
jgi:ribonuclease BN (tRNA processing enzyme)